MLQLCICGRQFHNYTVVLGIWCACVCCCLYSCFSFHHIRFPPSNTFSPAASRKQAWCNWTQDHCNRVFVYPCSQSHHTHHLFMMTWYCTRHWQGSRLPSPLHKFLCFLLPSQDQAINILLLPPASNSSTPLPRHWISSYFPSHHIESAICLPSHCIQPADP